MDKAFWDGLQGDLPEHRDRRRRPSTTTTLLDKFRTALLGNAGPMVVRLQILGGVEFAAKGYLQELKPEDVGYSTADFWPGAMKSVTWDGKTYGIPTNNETMALHLERQDLRRCRPRSGEAAGDLGRRRRLFQADPRQARHRRLRPGRQAERRQHAVPLHAAALGLWRRRARRSQRRRRPTRRSSSTAPEQGGAAGVLRHVCARQVGAGLGADQHAGREPGPVHRRPAGHDDRPPGRVRQDARPRQQGDRRRQGSRRRRGRQHALRPDPRRPGAPRRGVRRLQHPRPQARIRGRRDRRDGGEGAHLHVDQPGMVDASSPGSARTRATCAASRPSG